MTKRVVAQLPEILNREQRLAFPLVEALTGKRRTWIYSALKAGRFPEPERDGPRCSRWRAGDILDWLDAKRQTGTYEQKPSSGPEQDQPQQIQRVVTDEKGIADAFGVSVSFVRKDRAGKRLFPFFRIGDLIRYDIERVREALLVNEEGGPQKAKRRRIAPTDSMKGQRQ